MIKFPSIEQFRNTIKDVHQHTFYKNALRDEEGNILPASMQVKMSFDQPSLVFEGTVKLHGTNAGVVVDMHTSRDAPHTFQSRERELTLTTDNAGFCAWGMQKSVSDVFDEIAIDTVARLGLDSDKVVIFGEWCGGNIQKGVAITQLPKMFVIFGIQLISEEGSRWLNSQQVEVVVEDHRDLMLPCQIFTIWDFTTWRIEIDFNKPELYQNKLVEITQAVEEECPVGKSFGVSGIGEGVVWTCYFDGGAALRFKVKGEKHSSSKVKKLASVDVEKINGVQEFVDSVVTESRLEQGWKWLEENNLEQDVVNLGPFIKWVIGDVFKEEQDTIVENQLDAKIIPKYISNKARTWFMTKL